MQPKATTHLGICSECAGEREVISIEGDPLPLSLCPACLAMNLGWFSGIRGAIREQWRGMHRRGSERRAELQAKARADLERVAKMIRGTGGAFELGQADQLTNYSILVILSVRAGDMNVHVANRLLPSIR